MAEIQLDRIQISSGGDVYTFDKQPAQGSTIDKSKVEQIVSDYVTDHKDELKGDKGDKGDTGEQGPQGEQGPKGEDGSDASVVVDTAMSDTSENAVQNKAIKQYVDEKTHKFRGEFDEISGTLSLSILMMDSLWTENTQTLELFA